MFDCQGHAFYGPIPADLAVTKWDTGTITIVTGTLPGVVLSPIVDVADVIENCRFVNTTLGIKVELASNVTILNCSSLQQDLFAQLYYVHNISLINTTASHVHDFVSAMSAGNGYITSQNPYISLLVKNSRIISPSKGAAYAAIPGLVTLLNVNNVLIDNLTFINVSLSPYDLLFNGQDVYWSRLSNWKCINCSQAEITTWDMLYTNMSNIDLKNISFKPIYTLSHDRFTNISLRKIDIWSSTPFYPLINPLILYETLAYSSFNNIKTRGFATNYAYKCNFTNITVYNGTGFVLRSYLFPYNSQSIPIQYLISWDNRFVNITLLNNQPYDFYVLSPYLCTLLAHNEFKNVYSVGGAPILIASAISQTISGRYAEIYSCLNDSTLNRVTLSGSPFVQNDGIVLFGKNDVINNSASKGNFIGLAGHVVNLQILNSKFNGNVYGIGVSGNVFARNITANDNNETGLFAFSLQNSLFENSTFQNNGVYDVESTFPHYAPFNGLIYTYLQIPFGALFSTAVCYKNISFKNEKLSAGGRLAILNVSGATYQNKEYAEVVVCGENIKIRNITVQGNKSLKNDGIVILDSNYLSIMDVKANNVFRGLLMYYSNHTQIENSSFSNEKTAGVTIIAKRVWSPTISNWITNPSYNLLNNITTEHNEIGVVVSSSSNILNNISACFDKKVSFYFDSGSLSNIGADNTGNVTDLGTNPGFSADAGICYLSLLKPVFVPPTPANNSILSSTSITLNATSADPTLTNITLNLYNNTGLVKSVVCTSSPCSYSFTGLKLNQNYYFNATACDAEKQCASTGTYTTYLSPTTCALVLVVKNHLNKPLYIDEVNVDGKEYELNHVLLLPYQSKELRIENNGFCQYLGRVVFLDMTIHFSDSSHMTYEVSGEIALNS